MGDRLEDGFLQQTIGQANASYTALYHLILKKGLLTRAMSEKSSLKYKQQDSIYVNVFGSGSLPQRID